MVSLYEELLNKSLRILVYSGLEDGTDSNFYGTEKWLPRLNWKKKKQFSVAPTCVWKITNLPLNQNETAGYIKSYANLTYVKIRGAGHMAITDQPERLLFLLNQFIRP